jgi:2-polyprenyl-6-hydroxyphenyl methylase/3-demethylubiquinone-9 3-methyltransferase
VLTTINRTQASFWGAIIGAEYVLRIVPPGTHEWAKFVTPGEVQGVLEGQGLRVEKVTGLFYDPLFQRWGTTERLDINYAIVAMKPQLVGREGEEEEAGKEVEEGGEGQQK